MDFDNPPADPLPELRRWLEQASETDLHNPDAMTLATTEPDGRPSARMVLLKGLDSNGAVFYTNQRSRKAIALAQQPRAALLFYWDALHRQASIEGRVTPIADAEADAYFATRPRSAQIGAWASRQSEPIEDRAGLDAAVGAVEGRYRDQPVPRPPHWGATASDWIGSSSGRASLIGCTIGLNTSATRREAGGPVVCARRAWGCAGLSPRFC